MEFSPAAGRTVEAEHRIGADDWSEPIVFDDDVAIDHLKEGMHKEFPRPATPLNRLVAFLAGRMPQRDLTQANIRMWLANSLDVFSHLVDDQQALRRIGRETVWMLTNDSPPDHDVWSGECKFLEGERPVVICYRTTLACRLPGSAFEIAWQGSVDHFVGHLLPYFAGAKDASEYGEAVACQYQHLAAQYRARSDHRFRLVALLLPLTYWLHKRIPLSNYRSLASPS